MKFPSRWILSVLCVIGLSLPAVLADSPKTEDGPKLSTPSESPERGDQKDKKDKQHKKDKQDQPNAAPAVKKIEPTEFVRILHDENDEPVALQTAIVRYVPQSGKGGLELDLIGAVHVGDRAYYKQLNKEFENYEVVLYELVAEKGTRVPKGGRPGGDMLPVAMLKNLINLDSQLELIDYTKENFVHADMSPEEMGKAMKERGDDGFTVALGIIRDMLRESNRLAAKHQAEGTPLPEITLTDLLFNPDGGKKLKRVLALQLGDQASGEALGETLNTLLVSDRNKAALKVFQTELANGKKKMAIFYGAAHMPDFERRLITDYGLKRDSVRWLTAWDLK